MLTVWDVGIILENTHGCYQKKMSSNFQMTCLIAWVLISRGVLQSERGFIEFNHPRGIEAQEEMNPERQTFGS